MYLCFWYEAYDGKNFWHLIKKILNTLYIFYEIMYKKKKNNKLTLIEYACVFFNVLSKIFIFIYVKKTKCAFVSNVRKKIYLKSYVTWFAFEYFVKQIILLKLNLNTRKHGLGHIVFLWFISFMQHVQFFNEKRKGGISKVIFFPQASVLF